MGSARGRAGREGGAGWAWMSGTLLDAQALRRAVAGRVLSRRQEVPGADIGRKPRGLREGPVLSYRVAWVRPDGQGSGEEERGDVIPEDLGRTGVELCGQRRVGEEVT